MAIKELKKHNATTRSTPPRKRAVNTHDTDPHPEQPPTDTRTGDPTPPPPPPLSIQPTSIMSKHSSSHYGSLIDRGANGGLAGSDVRILERTGRTVSVTGIDNHELPGLDMLES